MPKRLVYFSLCLINCLLEIKYKIIVIRNRKMLITPLIKLFCDTRLMIVIISKKAAPIRGNLSFKFIFYRTPLLNYKILSKMGYLI